MSGEQGAGGRHLTLLAQRARAAGSDAERNARNYCASELERLGFSVTENAFTYSAFPGRFGTPMAGLLLLLTNCLTAAFALNGSSSPVQVLTLTVGASAMIVFSRAMTGDGVVDRQWLRAQGINLVATRGGLSPDVWLVAHIDSKSQPIPSLVRIGGVTLVAAAVLGTFLATTLTLAGIHARSVWWVIIALTVCGALPVMASVVSNHSDGAVDNASGVAAVLAAAALISPHVPIGILLPTAEELGLAGARAWVRNRMPAIALNVDGVDDTGSLVVMYNGAAPSTLVDAIRTAAGCTLAVRRMPLGLLTDSTAFAARGWKTVTLSHGSLRTLRRVHSGRDSLQFLRGDKVDMMATILARSAEALVI